MKKLRVLYHDNCFDGLASAAVFSSFYRGRILPGVEIEYEGLTHKAGQRIDEELFGSDDNVIVDFKYSASAKLTWWFDHHESAFLSESDEAHFRKDRSGKKFHDPNFKSCTKFIAAVAKDTFGFEDQGLSELVHWADVIDGAQFPNAQFAVELKDPAMRLMTVIEATRDRSLLHRIIRLLQAKTLEDVINESDVRSTFEGLYESHLKSIDMMRDRARCTDGVIEYDISDRNLEGQNKFIPYYLFPQAVYSVGVSLSPVRAKVSVGSNPWTRREHMENLAKLCEQYGGGGHAVVAAISFKPDALEDARAAAREIAGKLQASLKRA
ncbi:MAG TPA: DHH family phosphoesterase [Terriglobia bacterium]|nr:DHH family phosphoesterase [Terriglobia bacterium]